jgi:hypothetical protein
MKRIKLCVLLVAVAACGEVVTSEEDAVGAVAVLGWSDVKVTSRHGVAPGLRGCGEGDKVAYKVEGKNHKGEAVKGTVCCGWPLKGCTLRTP